MNKNHYIRSGCISEVEAAFKRIRKQLKIANTTDSPSIGQFERNTAVDEIHKDIGRINECVTQFKKCLPDDGQQDAFSNSPSNV